MAHAGIDGLVHHVPGVHHAGILAVHIRHFVPDIVFQAQEHGVPIHQGRVGHIRPVFSEEPPGRLAVPNQGVGPHPHAVGLGEGKHGPRVGKVQLGPGIVLAADGSGTIQHRFGLHLVFAGQGIEVRGDQRGGPFVLEHRGGDRRPDGENPFVPFCQAGGFPAR